MSLESRNDTERPNLAVFQTLLPRDLLAPASVRLFLYAVHRLPNWVVVKAKCLNREEFVGVG